MDKALGAPIREFGFNRWWAFFYGFGTLMFAVLAGSVFFIGEDHPVWVALLMGALATGCGYMLAQTVAARAVVHEAGISYRTLRSGGEMLWNEVNGYCYAVQKTYHQGVIPTTHYTITLVDESGNKADLGSNVQNPKELGDTLWKLLGQPLRAKMLAGVEAHKPVQLGRVKLTYEGVELNPPIGKKTFVPFPRLAGCELNNGMLRVFENVDGKRKAHALMLKHVQNIFPLMEILKTNANRTPVGAAVVR